MAASAKLEHVNITVSDPDRTADFLSRLCGWKRRWEGPAINDGHTIHLGDEHDYVALYRPKEPVEQRFDKGLPMNHIGIEVDDLDAAERVVTEAGLETFNHNDYEPGRRFYFFDWDGIEWEVVSYA